jgi:ribosomal protein S3
MNQINPLIFRSQYNKSKFFCGFKNYSLIVHQDIQIQRFIKFFFSKFNIFISNCVIKRNNKVIYIHVYCYNFLELDESNKKPYIQKTNSQNQIRKWLQNSLVFLTKSPVRVIYKNSSNYKLLKKEVFKTRNFSVIKNKTINFRSKGFGLTTLCLIYDSFLIKNPELISNYISFLVEKNIKNWRVIFKMLSDQIFFLYQKSDLKGFKLQLKGRLGGIKRTRKIIIKEGKIPSHSIQNTIKYSFTNCNTIHGTYGIKVWMYY